MGKWVHRLSDVDKSALTAVCSTCGPVGVYRSGNGVRCRTTKLALALTRYHSGDYGALNARRKLAADRGCCDECGFVAVDICQLDVDHVDGDWSNDDPENLQVLCANCHRLKTYRPEKAVKQK